MGTMGSFLEHLKRPKREADHSSAPSAEMQNAWSVTSTPSVDIYGAVLRHRSKITPYILLVVSCDFGSALVGFAGVASCIPDDLAAEESYVAETRVSPLQYLNIRAL